MSRQQTQGTTPIIALRLMSLSSLAAASDGNGSHSRPTCTCIITFLIHTHCHSHTYSRTFLPSFPSSLSSAGVLPLLDRERALQHGNISAHVVPVSIMPSVRIDGTQVSAGLSPPWGVGSDLHGDYGCNCQAGP